MLSIGLVLSIVWLFALRFDVCDNVLQGAAILFHSGFMRAFMIDRGVDILLLDDDKGDTKRKFEMQEYINEGQNLNIH